MSNVKDQSLNFETKVKAEVEFFLNLSLNLSLASGICEG